MTRVKGLVNVYKPAVGCWPRAQRRTREDLVTRRC